MTLIETVPYDVYELDINAFRTSLNDKQDDEEGIVFPTTHTHNTEVSVGGVTLARVITLINGYTVTFQNAAYAVSLVGANNNVGDVTNLNTVSIRSANSAGLTSSADPWESPMSDYTTPGSAGKVLKERLSRNDFLGLK